ncbi:MAG: hypothetical protein R2912_12405 [Eubacteriales bacterium]
MVADIAPEDCPVIFLPFLFGTNVNADAKACFLGISGLHTKAHMLRARCMRASRSRTARIWKTCFASASGLPASAFGRRRCAPACGCRSLRMFQIPIEVSAGKELGTMGAAMCAGIASGAFADFLQAVDVFSKVEYTCMPNPDRAQLYEDKFRLYTRLSAQLDETWKDWDKILKK